MRDKDANVSEGRDHLLRDMNEQMVSHRKKNIIKMYIRWTMKIHKINLKKLVYFCFHLNHELNYLFMLSIPCYNICTCNLYIFYLFVLHAFVS